jgi:hypothetical protein
MGILPPGRRRACTGIGCRYSPYVLDLVVGPSPVGDVDFSYGGAYSEKVRGWVDMAAPDFRPER